MCYKIVYKIFVKYVKKRIKAKLKNPPKTGKNNKKTIIHPKVIQAQLQTEDGCFLNHYFTYYIWPLLSNIKWMELIWLFAVSLNFVKIETEGIDSQDAPSGQINVHGVRHICTKFHESITMCSMLMGRSPTTQATTISNSGSVINYWCESGDFL